MSSEIVLPKKDVIIEWQKHLSKMLVNRDFFSKYELREILGEGGFSQVYRVIEKKTGKVSAAKVIKHKMIYSDKRGVLLMKQEIDIMRQLDHPNIVKLIEVQEVHNAVVLIMEYVDGSELKKLNMGLSFQDVITIVHAILSVLSYLENLGIVHRDLKPSNIMITKGEFVQTDSVKLFDFGLAAFLSEKLLLTKCGTPGYIAPEILCASSKDKIVVSPSVDVYSLGIILYEMLFKSNPFKDASKPDSKRVVRKNAQSSIDYDRPCIYKPFITPQFMQLLVDMTQKSDITRPLASTLLESEVFKAVCKTGRKEKKSPDYHPMLEENVVSQLSKDTYRFKVNQNRFRADSPTIKRFLPRPTPLLIDPITTLDPEVRASQPEELLSPINNTRNKYKGRDFEEYSAQSPTSLDKRYKNRDRTMSPLADPSDAQIPTRFSTRATSSAGKLESHERHRHASSHNKVKTLGEMDDKGYKGMFVLHQVKEESQIQLH